jgi:hypothetical protein
MSENENPEQDKPSRLARIRELSDRLAEISKDAERVSAEAQDAQLKQMAALIERTRALLAKFTKQ